MRSPVTPQHYIDPEIQKLEQERIFRKLWIFAGLKQALSKNNSFITRKIGGIPVVIQNTGGKLYAFENICAHRQMAIQTEPQGCRPLVCRYHAWAYDAEGKLRAKGNNSLYELTSEEEKSACLKRFALAEIGNLIFVNLDDKPMEIEQQFTKEHIQKLREASSHFDDEFAYSVFEKKYNWKLGFENALDFNHVPFLHPKTFAPSLKATKSMASSEYEIPIRDRKTKEELDKNAPIDLRDLSYSACSSFLLGIWYDNLVHRYRSEDVFYNWYCYPNINFASARGSQFIIQQYMPIAPNRTEFHLWILTAKKKKPGSFAALLWQAIRFEKFVIEEDSVPLESLQAGLHAGAPPYLHGIYEGPIVKSLRWYVDQITGANRAPQLKAIPSNGIKHEKARRYR